MDDYTFTFDTGLWRNELGLRSDGVYQTATDATGALGASQFVGGARTARAAGFATGQGAGFRIGPTTARRAMQAFGVPPGAAEFANFESGLRPDALAEMAREVAEEDVGAQRQRAALAILASFPELIAIVEEAKAYANTSPIARQLAARDGTTPMTAALQLAYKWAAETGFSAGTALSSASGDGSAAAKWADACIAAGEIQETVDVEDSDDISTFCQQAFKRFMQQGAHLAEPGLLYLLAVAGEKKAVTVAYPSGWAGRRMLSVAEAKTLFSTQAKTDPVESGVFNASASTVLPFTQKRGES